MLIDMHVHTNRYSKCSHISPATMASTALAAGLDAVVITEHNVIWSKEEIAELQAEFPSLLIMRAFEVSAANKHDILIYGVSDISGFEKGMPVREVVDRAHALGGLAVLAHPFRYREDIEPEVLAARFDACETRSVNIDPYHHEKGVQLARQLGVPAVYNSDGHHEVSIGGYCNDFHKAIRNEAELIEALRQGAFTPHEFPDLVAPALAARVERIREGILRCIDRGITDPEGVWKRVGNARQRINEMLPEILDSYKNDNVG